MNRKTFLASLITIPAAVKAVLSGKKSSMLSDVSDESIAPHLLGEKYGWTPEYTKEFIKRYNEIAKQKPRGYSWTMVDDINMPSWVRRIRFHIKGEEIFYQDVT